MLRKGGISHHNYKSEIHKVVISSQHIYVNGKLLKKTGKEISKTQIEQQMLPVASFCITAHIHTPTCTCIVPHEKPKGKCWYFEESFQYALLYSHI